MKIWKIERMYNFVTTWWGPARLKKRCPVPVGKLQSKTQKLRTIGAAIKDECRRIQEKLNKGYKRNPRRRKANANHTT